MIANTSTQRRLLIFTGIGATSTLAHIAVVAILVTLGMKPLVANIFAFLIAFNCSYFGHRYLTFANMADDKQLQLPHFFLVAATAGLLNEYHYYLFLRHTQLHYLVALIIVVSIIAVFTFVASRFWACR